MTESEKLTTLKVLIDEDITDISEDSTLTVYLSVAGKKILNRLYPFDDSINTLPAQYEMLQCEIAAYLFLKRGAEGQTGHSENSISRTYESADIPESMWSGVTPKVSVL